MSPTIYQSPSVTLSISTGLPFAPPSMPKQQAFPYEDSERGLASEQPHHVPPAARPTLAGAPLRWVWHKQSTSAQRRRPLQRRRTPADLRQDLQGCRWSCPPRCRC